MEPNRKQALEQANFAATLLALASPLVKQIAGQVVEEITPFLDERPPAKVLYSQQDTAAMFDVSTPTLRGWVEQGAPFVWAGEHRKFDPRDLKEWLQQRTAEKGVSRG